MQRLRTNVSQQPQKVLRKKILYLRTHGNRLLDRKSVLLIYFMSRGATVNTDAYCEIDYDGVVCCLVVSCSSTTRPSTKLLQQIKWESFDHPPCSPDLSPSDFHLFTKFRNVLVGTCFAVDEELNEGVNTFLKELVPEE